jgi:hypothetical protein
MYSDDTTLQCCETGWNHIQKATPDLISYTPPLEKTQASIFASLSVLGITPLVFHAFHVPTRALALTSAAGEFAKEKKQVFRLAYPPESGSVAHVDDEDVLIHVYTFLLESIMAMADLAMCHASLGPDALILRRFRARAGANSNDCSQRVFIVDCSSVVFLEPGDVNDAHATLALAIVSAASALELLKGSGEQAVKRARTERAIDEITKHYQLTLRGYARDRGAHDMTLVDEIARKYNLPSNGTQFFGALDCSKLHDVPQVPRRRRVLRHPGYRLAEVEPESSEEFLKPKIPRPIVHTDSRNPLMVHTIYGERCERASPPSLAKSHKSQTSIPSIKPGERRLPPRAPLEDPRFRRQGELHDDLYDPADCQPTEHPDILTLDPRKHDVLMSFARRGILNDPVDSLDELLYALVERFRTVSNYWLDQWQKWQKWQTSAGSRPTANTPSTPATPSTPSAHRTTLKTKSRGSGSLAMAEEAPLAGTSRVNVDASKRRVTRSPAPRQTKRRAMTAPEKAFEEVSEKAREKASKKVSEKASDGVSVKLGRVEEFSIREGAFRRLLTLIHANGDGNCAFHAVCIAGQSVSWPTSITPKQRVFKKICDAYPNPESIAALRAAVKCELCSGKSSTRRYDDNFFVDPSLRVPSTLDLTGESSPQASSPASAHRRKFCDGISRVCENVSDRLCIWGDHLSLTALANYYDLVIYCGMLDMLKKDKLNFRQLGDMKRRIHVTAVLFLRYTGNGDGHYDAYQYNSKFTYEDVEKLVEGCMSTQGHTTTR